MDIWNALARAKRGLRDDAGLHIVAVASLVVAFLCLTAALLSVSNLSRVAERWGKAQHLTVYLDASARDGDVAQLRLVLESLHEIAKVELVTSEQARREFAEQVVTGLDASTLPADAFPASLEIALHEHVTDARIGEIAEKVKRFTGVEQVETYRDFLGQVGTLAQAGRAAVGLLALLVGVCVLAIIGNTIRLAVTSRKREIEVLKLCGATDGYVRTPFVLEGALQASAAALVALVLLLVAYLSVRGSIEATLSAITGVRMEFLPASIMLAVVITAGAIGALGSALSLRRYLRV